MPTPAHIGHDDIQHPSIESHIKPYSPHNSKCIFSQSWPLSTQQAIEVPLTTGDCDWDWDLFCDWSLGTKATTHTHTPTRARVRTHISTRTYVNTYIHTCRQAGRQASRHTCIHACMHTYRHTYIPTYVKIHNTCTDGLRIYSLSMCSLFSCSFFSLYLPHLRLQFKKRGIRICK